jgi:peptide deformylase
VFKIVVAPNPVLSSIAKPVSKVTPSVTKIIEEMKKTLNKTTDPKGVGLAAPQVGKSLQIFIAKPTDNSKILVFINPEIIEHSPEQDYIKRPARNALARNASRIDASGSHSAAGGPKKDEGEKASKKLEGCLSLPAIWGPVRRSSRLVLSYMDELGNQHKQKFSNFLATIIQHEMDHLNGILFPKKVLEQNGILYKSHKNKKGEDEFEEIEI